MDFERQLVNHRAFGLPTTVVVPGSLGGAIRRQGAAQAKLVRHSGLKKELYVGDSESYTEILTRLGIEPRPRIVAVLRAPPSRVVYHGSSNPLFEETLRAVCRQPGVVWIVLTHPEQIAAIDGLISAIAPCPAGSRDRRRGRCQSSGGRRVVRGDPLRGGDFTNQGGLA
jgi:hypothetical protein